MLLLAGPLHGCNHTVRPPLSVPEGKNADDRLGTDRFEDAKIGTFDDASDAKIAPTRGPRAQSPGVRGYSLACPLTGSCP